MRILTTLAYLTFLILAVPWYWPLDSELTWFGFPAWVVSSMLISTVASAVTAFIFLKSRESS